MRPWGGPGAALGSAKFSAKGIEKDPGPTEKAYAQFHQDSDQVGNSGWRRTALGFLTIRNRFHLGATQSGAIEGGKRKK